MKRIRIALLTGVLLASSAGATEPRPGAGEAARQAMQEGMMKQAAMPVRPPTMPMMTPGGGAPSPRGVPPAKERSDAAHQRGMESGMHDADAMRAEMANRAAHGGAMGTMMQSTGDMMKAPMMQRSQGMDPGGGMMPGGSTGGGGMGPGGMGGGGMTTPATAPTGAPGATPPAMGGR